MGILQSKCINVFGTGNWHNNSIIEQVERIAREILSISDNITKNSW